MDNNAYLLACNRTGAQTAHRRRGQRRTDSSPPIAGSGRPRRCSRRHPPALGPPQSPGRGALGATGAHQHQPEPMTQQALPVTAGPAPSSRVTRSTFGDVVPRRGPPARPHPRVDRAGLRRPRRTHPTCSPATHLFPGGVGNTKNKGPGASTPFIEDVTTQGLRRLRRPTPGCIPDTGPARRSVQNGPRCRCGTSAAGSRRHRLTGAVVPPGPARA